MFRSLREAPIKSDLELYTKRCVMLDDSCPAVAREFIRGESAIKWLREKDRRRSGHEDESGSGVLCGRPDG